MHQISLDVPSAGAGLHERITPIAPIADISFIAYIALHTNMEMCTIPKKTMSSIGHKGSAEYSNHTLHFCLEAALLCTKSRRSDVNPYRYEQIVCNPTYE